MAVIHTILSAETASITEAPVVRPRARTIAEPRDPLRVQATRWLRANGWQYPDTWLALKGVEIICTARSLDELRTQLGTMYDDPLVTIYYEPLNREGL
jgi:hypothetical protein